MIKSVHILGCDFPIEMVPSDHPAMEEAWGSFEHKDQKFYVQADLAEGIAKETLFHEIIHAVDDMLVSEGLTEKQIFRLSVVLYAVLRDNGELRSYLFGEEASDAAKCLEDRKTSIPY